MQSEAVKAKKYFYVLRPVLCCRWLEKYRTAAPISFDELRKTVLPESLAAVIDNLLEIKRTADESETIAHIGVLDDFLLSVLDCIQSVMNCMGRVMLHGFEALNVMLRETIRTVWG